jgi:hypothetical protein
MIVRNRRMLELNHLSDAGGIHRKMQWIYFTVAILIAGANPSAQGY